MCTQMGEPRSAWLRNTSASSVAGYVAFFFESAVGVVVSILVVRALSISDFGAYKIAGSIIMVGSYLTSCGLDPTLQRFGAELIARQQFGVLLKFFNYVRLVRIFALVVFCTGVMLMRRQIADVLAFPDALSFALPLILAILCLQSAVNIFGFTFFSARGDFIELSIVRVVGTFLRLASLSLVFVVSADLMGALGAILFASSIVFVYVVLRNKNWLRNRRENIGVPVEIDHLRGRIFRYSWVAYLAVNVNVFRDLSVDNFVIAHYLGTEKVAVYGLAGTLILFANTMNPSVMLRNLITPMLVARHAMAEDNSGLVRAFRLLTKAVMLMHYPLVTLLLVLGGEMIRLVYSPAYLAAYQPLIILCLFSYFLGLSSPFSPLIAALEKNTLWLLSGTTAIYNLALDIWLVPKFGVLGAAFATGSAGLLQLILFWIAFKYVAGIAIEFPFAVLGRTLLNLALPVAIALFARGHVTNLFELIGLMLVCGGLYMGAVYWNHGLDDTELARFGIFFRRRNA